jgi:hypothetical protein
VSIRDLVAVVISEQKNQIPNNQKKHLKQEKKKRNGQRQVILTCLAAVVLKPGPEVSF